MPRFKDIPQDLVIDVRSRLEHLLGHLEGSICIPVDQLPDALIGRAGVTEDSRILVYCASGARSAAAASALRAAGYRRVTDGGGISAARQEYAAA